MSFRIVPGVLAAVLLAGCSGTMSQSASGMPSGMTATPDPMVGGAAMYPNKTIVQDAVNSPDHTTLVAAVKAAGLVDTLNGPGPFTVFAPTNEAFAMLTKVLTYHVVAGSMDSKALMAAIVAGGGRATLTTVASEPLVAMMSAPGTITLTDANDDVSAVTIADVYQSNGVIHVMDHVLLPN